MAKIVFVDNYGRDYVADILCDKLGTRNIPKNVSEEKLQKLADAINDLYGPEPNYYAVVKDDDYVLADGDPNK